MNANDNGACPWCGSPFSVVSVSDSAGALSNFSMNCLNPSCPVQPRSRIYPTRSAAMSATTAALPGEIRVRQDAMREAKHALVRKLRKVFCEVIVDQETWERHLPGIKYLTE